VVVFYRGEVLGCGLYSHGKLISQLPKERRMDAKMQGEDI
jgi:NOL1/NOP2/fmu family ribosome biogenesis protein